jgi:hypothetical protein
MAVPATSGPMTVRRILRRLNMCNLLIVVDVVVTDVGR